jgi:hypothetical protein
MTTTNNTMSELVVLDLVIMAAVIQVTVFVLSLELEASNNILNDINESLFRLDYNYSSTYKRKKWSDVLATIPDTPFKRMFRCNKEVFSSLVSKIQDYVDPAVFKSDDWLDNINNISYIQAISGEVKIACTLRMLAGASYLDLLVIYNISQVMLYEIFHEAVQWINRTFSFPLYDFIDYEQTDKLQDIALLYSDRSDGIINGCIGACDQN